MRELVIHEPMIDFASNDYLGFSKCPILKEKILKQASSFHLGSTGSRLLTGNSNAHEDLEAKIARFFDSPTSLVVSSGYIANLSLFSAIASRDDHLFFDKKVHASIRDGIVLSRSRAAGFEHNDLNALERLLKRNFKKAFVAIESIYSVDGSLAPIKEISFLCEKYGAHLIVDEAHATGVFGKGLCHHFFAKIVTFSKAFGVSGGAILGGLELKNHLINTSRPFIYTTAIPFYSVVAINEALDHLESSSAPKYLHDLMRYFEIKTPIFSVKVNDAKKQEKEFAQKKLAVSALRPPTTDIGEECLRICLHAFNTHEEVDQLCQLL